MIYGQANLHKHHDGCSLFEHMTDVGEKETLRSNQRKPNYQKQKEHKTIVNLKYIHMKQLKEPINHFLVFFSVEQSLDTVSNVLISDKKVFFSRKI